ncbi:ATP-binding protein [Acidiphilium sp. PA]|uniref:ATP-binding protein n=1 Tax=Acidiphilium sp. PA TaxID=2871705 RepID=UPI0022437573|nr:ATP-binding protein [Acidiphilium sp. PA]MCW8307547.1 ATP-binding protein [Acidiphilium sp. PA]
MDYSQLTPGMDTQSLIAAFDWGATVLGARDDWPVERICAVDLALRSPAPIALFLGPDGVLLYNDACAALFGVWHPRALGMAVTEVFPEHAVFCRSMLERVRRGEAVLLSDRALSTGNVAMTGQCGFDFSYTPIIAERNRVDGVFTVITETPARARAREREGTGSNLRQSEKMAVIGQLTGGIAHDFNNLLAGIIGNLDMLTTRLAQRDLASAESYLAGARSAASRAAGLTQRLLAFSGKQSLVPTVIDIPEFLLDIEELLSHTVGPTIELRTRCDPAVGAAVCDYHQLETALLNLAINARDAMPDGGYLTIEACRRTLGTPDDGDAAAPGRYVVVSVMDTGCGMTEDVAARAFDPFFTTRKRGHGAGLGLSMIYGFLKQSGGHVELQSRPGMGTIVRLFLPCETAAGAIGSADSAAQMPQPETKDVILVVDDEPDLRALLAEMLEGLGFSVLQAADAAAALDVLSASGRIDLLISDIGLRGAMNGRCLVEAAHAIRPALPVLFITGLGDVSDAARIVAGPRVDLLRKPFSFSVFEDRVERLLARVT